MQCHWHIVIKTNFLATVTNSHFEFTQNPLQNTSHSLKKLMSLISDFLYYYREFPYRLHDI